VGETTDAGIGTYKIEPGAMNKASEERSDELKLLVM